MTRGRRARQSRFHRSHARQSVGIRGAFPPSGDGGYQKRCRNSDEFRYERVSGNAAVGCSPLCQDAVDNMSMYIRQAAFNTVVIPGQSCVIDAQQVQSCGVQVVAVGG